MTMSKGDEKRHEIKQMYESGMSIYRVADATGFNRETVRRTLQRSGVKMRKHSKGGKHRKRAPLFKCKSCESVIYSGELCNWCTEKDKPKGYYLYKKDFVV